MGKPVGKRVLTARASGPDLTNSQDGSFISSSVEIVETAAMARADRAILADPKFADCIAQVAKGRLGNQGAGDVASERVDVKHYGDYSAAIKTTLSGTSNGQPQQLIAVQVGILKGRAEVMATFVTNGTQPFDQATGQSILDKLNRRLAKAKT